MASFSGRSSTWSAVVLLAICNFAVAINIIDNALLDSPSVQCGPENMEIVARTERPFEGVVYIKDWRRVDGCYSNVNTTIFNSTPRLSVPLNDLGRCGLELKRKAETGEVIIRGIFVFSFHPMFVTKVDKAYAVHCIFRQKEFTVTSKFSINDYVTKGTIGRTAPLPTAVMKIISGSSLTPDPISPSVTQVNVGDPLLFVWYLPAPSEMYGLHVRDCTAENKRGSRVKILDDGCTMDDVAISNVGYSQDRDRGYASAHAFKFADNEDMWFKCSITICMKFRPNSTSISALDDACDRIKTCNGTRRYKRDLSLQQSPLEHLADGDILEQRLTILDSYNENQSQSLLTESTNRQITFYSKQLQVKKVRKPNPWVVCMRKPVFALVSSVVLIMYIATFILGTIAVIVYCRRRYGEPSFSKSPDY